MVPNSFLWELPISQIIHLCLVHPYIQTTSSYHSITLYFMKLPRGVVLLFWCCKTNKMLHENLDERLYAIIKLSTQDVKGQSFDTIRFSEEHGSKVSKYQVKLTHCNATDDKSSILQLIHTCMLIIKLGHSQPKVWTVPIELSCDSASQRFYHTWSNNLATAKWWAFCVCESAK